LFIKFLVGGGGVRERGRFFGEGKQDLDSACV